MCFRDTFNIVEYKFFIRRRQQETKKIVRSEREQFLRKPPLRYVFSVLLKRNMKTHIVYASNVRYEYSHNLWPVVLYKYIIPVIPNWCSVQSKDSVSQRQGFWKKFGNM